MCGVQGEYPKEIEGIAIPKGGDWLNPTKIKYPAKQVRPCDIVLKVEACGVCGSDIHTANGSWGKKDHDIVVGHEIIGRVVAVGEGVTKHKIGDRIGVGAQADACLKCTICQSDNEQYCTAPVFTYESAYPDGYISKGGYASHVVVNQHFVVRIPDEIPSNLAGPLLCGGITAYSPLLRNNTGPGKHVGIVGIGGIGHMAILLAKAMGAKVTAISRGSSKKEDALKLGADDYIATSEDSDYVTKRFRTLDFILVTASSLTGIDFNTLPKLLRVGGSIVSISVPPRSEVLSVSPLSLMGISVGSSILGSVKEIEQMLALVVEKNIKIWVEPVPINEKNVATVLQRMEKGDVRYRFVFVDYDKEFQT